MNLDRALQRKILEELADEYPNYGDFYIRFSEAEFLEQVTLQANLFYLQEHGLITGTFLGGIPRDFDRIITRATITHDGLDFLADDGGLGAILKTVTVRFDVNNIRALLEDKIIASSLPQEEKDTLRKRISSFSGDMLKDIVLKLVDKGLDRPDLLATLMGLVSKVPAVL